MGGSPGHDDDGATGDAPGYEAMRPSYWAAVARRRRRVVAGVALALLGIVAAGLIAASGGSDGAGQPRPPRAFTPAEETSRAVAPTTPALESTPAAAPAPQGAPAGQDGVAPLVAYRRDGWVCVADENGSGERRVARSASGVFALSPDGATLAIVDAASGTLAIVDCAAGTARDIGPAAQAAPSWAPDSSWLAYTAPGPVVTRVGRDGGGRTALFPGAGPSVGPSGGAVAAVSADGGIVLWRDGATSRPRTTGVVTAVACGIDRVHYGSSASGGTTASVRSVGFDGAARATLVERTASERGVTIGDLLVSRDDATLAYAELGDDGHASLFVVPTAGGGPVSLCVRRDCYPLRWSSDGAALFFIEGNRHQGDPTALMRARADGTARRLLVDGATR